MTEGKSEPIICAICGNEICSSSFTIFMNPEIEDIEDPWFETILVCDPCRENIKDYTEKFDPTSLLTLFGVNGLEEN